MKQTSLKITGDAPRPPNRFSTYAIIALVLAGFLVLVFVARAHYQALNAARILNHNQQQHLAYKNVLKEMHTGLRLARWQDFVEHAPVSKYTQAARLHISTLDVHEKSAWSNFSETLYKVNAKGPEITAARLLYISHWGELHRTDQLVDNRFAKSDKALSFQTAKSIYVKGRGADALIGGPQKPSRKLRPKPIPKTAQKPISNSVIDVRIKSSRKPKYPRAAKRRGISAIIVLSLNIDARGRVVSAQLVSVKAKRYRGDFIRAAKRAARRSRFHPKTVNGRPVNRGNYLRTYIFTLKD